MKLLITGADGQLGRELARLADTADILLTDAAELDITDRQAVEAFVGGARPDVILNCAAMTDVDACETKPEDALRVNALGPRNLAMAAEGADASLVHISTDYVFSGEGRAPLREWDLPDPKTVYGKSKLLGEQYVSRFCQRHFIVRTSWLYGPDGHNFVKTILRHAREKGALKVVDDQRGCPTYTADLARCLLRLAGTREYGLYHCAGGGECTWYEFACEIVRLSGIPCEVSPCATAEFPRPAPRPAYSVLDNAMLRGTGGDPMRPWREALADFMETYGGAL
ncbi:MAG: dTDP-4-dehydrorhamnose reductase [Oscillospiraceae bacterium]|nr:dTDP-4-dehydrorhamnose reductase [Oscillospiraceae bacterium]